MFLVMDLSCAYCYFSLWRNSVERGLKADDVLAPDKNGRLGGFALFLSVIQAAAAARLTSTLLTRLTLDWMIVHVNSCSNLQQQKAVLGFSTDFYIWLSTCQGPWLLPSVGETSSPSLSCTQTLLSGFNSVVRAALLEMNLDLLPVDAVVFLEWPCLFMSDFLWPCLFMSDFLYVTNGVSWCFWFN